MYNPAHFEETRTEVLHALIREFPLATLVTLSAGELTANHIPLELEAAAGPLGTLRGHVARANPVWREASPEHGALAIFHGPQAYITPSWYATKQETGAVVPTWNYVVVHAAGPLRIVDDATWLDALVARLTAQMEAARPEPWAVSDAPRPFIKKQLGAIVGIEIPIAKLVGKRKLSQNRNAADRAGVRAGLAAGGHPMDIGPE